MHLDDDLSLIVLAGIAGLSPYHFSHSFKQTTGVGPQYWPEPAKTPLRRTYEPHAPIVQEAGFAM